MSARYGVDHPLIPDSDPSFVWTDACRDVAEAIEHDERVFVYGPSGTGKSSLVRQIAALTGRPVRRVSLNGETSVSDFIGHWTVNEQRQTVFVRGILPQAMIEGHILQLDEIDAMQPEIGFTLQQVLEPGGRLLLTDTGEEIAPHGDFRLVATANTLGFGSDSGLYASGTHVLNFSWLDRWDVVVHVDYLPQNEEVGLLRARHSSLQKNLLISLVRAAGDLRRAHAEEQLTTTITTRRLLALCARLARGNEFPRALQTTILNKVPPEDRKVIAETFDHHVGPTGK
ncbi:MAG: AAA family ATPase [Phycisphaerales bacterium]|nr:AAA family ATPase [Phycisphaerales bacterium]MCB9862897.1 AAA family ATPase [Phycisphaerales bacterium]